MNLCAVHPCMTMVPDDRDICEFHARTRPHTPAREAATIDRDGRSVAIAHNVVRPSAGATTSGGRAFDVQRS